MKNIYIVLTYTGTVISKLIKSYTKDEFAHSSIALDIDLKEMYSFGRLNPYTPLFAGFVHEYIDKGTFKRFYKTRTKIYSLQITDEQYRIIEELIEDFKTNKSKYKFNIIGLYAAGFNIKIQPKNYFYCAEFVKYALEKAGLELDLPEIIKPEHFKRIEGLRQVYAGLLQEYRTSRKETYSKIISGELFNKEKEIV